MNDRPFEPDVARRHAGVDLRLLIWLSPSFPVGSFAYSHGLEYAVERGWIHDRATLLCWLEDLVSHGSLRSDLILAAEAWRAAMLSDCTLLRCVNETALALQPSAERHLETITQGTSFLSTIETTWMATDLSLLSRALGHCAAYPVAVGVAGAVHGIALNDVATAYATAFAGALISAAIRLSVVGQTDGQRILAALMPLILTATKDLAEATLDCLGTASLRSDLASAAHETQYTRLFRS